MKIALPSFSAIALTISCAISVWPPLTFCGPRCSVPRVYMSAVVLPAASAALTSGQVIRPNSTSGSVAFIGGWAKAGPPVTATRPSDTIVQKTRFITAPVKATFDETGGGRPRRQYNPARMPRLALIALLVAAQQLGPALPQPFHTPWYRKATRVVAIPDLHLLPVPHGFAVSLYADHLQFARFMALAPNGDVFLAEPVRVDGRITILRDTDHYGVADARETFAAGLHHPFGLSFWKNDPY